jgi:metal-sulfur cluster biosynthetic enzyme
MKPKSKAATFSSESASRHGRRNRRIAMPVSEDAVREELKKVIDPELFVNIVDLGLIYVVNVRPEQSGELCHVSVDMTMTSPACPAGPQLIAEAKDAISRMRGVKDVEVRIVMDPPWTPDRMTDDARDELGLF